MSAVRLAITYTPYSETKATKATLCSAMLDIWTLLRLHPRATRRTTGPTDRAAPHQLHSRYLTSWTRPAALQGSALRKTTVPARAETIPEVRIAVELLQNHPVQARLVSGQTCRNVDIPASLTTVDDVVVIDAAGSDACSGLKSKHRKWRPRSYFTHDQVY